MSLLAKPGCKQNTTDPLFVSEEPFFFGWPINFVWVQCLQSPNIIRLPQTYPQFLPPLCLLKLKFVLNLDEHFSIQRSEGRSSNRNGFYWRVGKKLCLARVPLQDSDVNIDVHITLSLVRKWRHTFTRTGLAYHTFTRPPLRRSHSLSLFFQTSESMIYGIPFQKILESIKSVRASASLIGQYSDVPKFTWKLVSPPITTLGTWIELLVHL